LEAAIRMLFSGEDSFAVLTVAGAAHRILRDLAENSGQCSIHEFLKTIIRPGMEKQFWVAMNKPLNFLKHADQDAGDLLEIDDQAGDSTIFMSCVYFESLGFETTGLMRVFCAWYTLLHPNLLLETAPMKSLFSDPAFDQCRSMSRSDQLKLGNTLSRMAGVVIKRM
jgi:hypothetical protein